MTTWTFSCSRIVKTTIDQPQSHKSKLYRASNEFINLSDMYGPRALIKQGIIYASVSVALIGTSTFMHVTS